MNTSRLLALFTVCFVIGIGLAALATHAVAQWRITERYHPAWCRVVAFQDWGDRIAVHEMGLPCKYRTNTPVDV